MPTKNAVASAGGESHDLWALADLATPMAVRVVATLRIADHLAAGTRTAPDLAGAVTANADVLDRVLRHLVTAGVFSRDGSGRYALTALGDALRDDHPNGMRARLDIEGAVGRADLSFVQLLHTVRTGEPAYPAQFGHSFWEDLSSDAGLAASFDSLMGVDVTMEAPDIVSTYDWGSLGHVVDVGGGNGSLLIALLTAHRALRGTVVDLPGATDAARMAFRTAGFADRADAVAGSFFDRLPPGRGGYVLSAIIHNWGDRAARTILRRCADAAAADGKVFVIERIGANAELPNTARDLRSLAYFGGRERGLAELTALAADSGLKLAAVHSAGANSIVELTARP